MNIFELAAKLSLDKSDYDRGLKSAQDSAGSFSSKVGSAISTGAKKVGGALANIGKLAVAATAAAGAAIVSFSKSAVSAGMTFDSSMSQVAATMGKTVDEIQELRDFAMEMGAATAFSASQAADALNYMALAGYDAETSMSMLPNVLNLAAAGGIELARASDMITDAQSALGLSLDETTELVDKMAQAASKSNTSVAQLGDAILTVGGTAKILQGGTTELATVLGILADNGVKGAEGGTALRNILNSLTAPTNQAAGKLEELGVSAFDAEGNMRSLNDIFLDLNESMEGFTQQQRADVISTLFNARDMKSAEALLANVGDRYEELSGYIDDAAGAAEKMANTQLDNLAGDITLFKSALEGAQIVLSDKLTPGIRKFVQFGTNGIQKLTNAFKKDGLNGVMKALGELLSDGVNMIIEGLPGFIEAAVELVKAVVKGILDNGDKIVDAAFDIIKILLKELLSPKNIKAVVSSAMRIIKVLVNGLAENIDLIFTAAVDIILALADGLLDPDNLFPLIEATFKLVGKLIESIIKNAPRLVEGAAEIVKKLGEGIGEKMSEIWDKGEEIVKNIDDAIRSKLEETEPGRQFLSIVDDLKEALSDAWTAVSDWFDEHKGDFELAWEGIKETSREGVSSLWEKLKEFFSWIGEKTEWLRKEVAPLGEAIIGFFAEGYKKIGDFFGMLKDVVFGVITAITTAVSNFIRDHKEKIDNFINWLNGVWNGFVNGIKNLFFGFIEWITGKFEDLVYIISNLISGMTKAMQGDFEGAFDDMRKAVGRFGYSVEGDLKGIYNQFDSWSGGLLTDASNWGSDLIDNFVGGIESGWNTLKGAVSGVANGIASFLGFSEPERGPLSNFHTFAPDMMKLFAQGIKDNENIIYDQLEKSFDFAPTIKAGYSGAAGNNIVINVNAAAGMNEAMLAEEVERKLMMSLNRRQAVWA